MLLTMEGFEVLTDVDEAPYFKVDHYNEKKGDRVLYSTSTLAHYLFNQLSSETIIFEQVRDQRAQIMMTIKADGKLSNISIEEGINEEVDQMMVDYLKYLNNHDSSFEPAKKAGKAVDSDFVFTFQFPNNRCDNQAPCNKIFDKEALKVQISDLYKLSYPDEDEFLKVVTVLVKDYLQEYPDDHQEVLMTLQMWGVEKYNKVILWRAPSSTDKNKTFSTFPIENLEDFTLEIFTLYPISPNYLAMSNQSEDWKNIAKENIKELTYREEPSSKQTLRDYLRFSYHQRYRTKQIELLNDRFKEIIEEEEMEVYDDFKKVEIITDAALPAELLAIKDKDLDDPSMPIISTQEHNLEQSLSEFIDMDKPIAAVYYLPPEEATIVFGDQGSKGFYALMGYERPLSHPEKQRELREFELENFFKTLANDVNEKDWIERLKKIHKKMQERYPKAGDLVTPFTTKAHKYNINLVIKDKEIIAAYRDGVERIDQAKNGGDINRLLERTSFAHDLSTIEVIQNFYKYGNRQIPLLIIENEEVNISELQSLDNQEITSIEIMTSAIGLEEYGAKGVQGVIMINSTSKLNTEDHDTNGAIIRPEPIPQGDDKVYKVVQEMPRFPGCELLDRDKDTKMECAEEKMIAFIYNNLNYPKQAKENRIEGRVYIQFIVEKDGTLSNAEIVRDIGAGCGFEALKIVDKMNQLYERWTPGKHKGEVVRVVYIVPVTFELPDPDELPLYIIDGTIVDELTFEDFNTNNIQQFIGLSVEDAMKKYGEKGKNGAHEIISKKGTRVENVLSPSDRRIFNIAGREPYLKKYITYKTVKLRFAESQKDYKVDLYEYYDGESSREALEYFITDIDSDIIDAKKVTDDGYFTFTLKNTKVKTAEIHVIYLDKEGYNRYKSQKKEELVNPIHEKINEELQTIGYDTVLIYDPETFTETVKVVPRKEGAMANKTFPVKEGLIYLIDGVISTQEEYDKLDKEKIISTRSFEKLNITDVDGTRELGKVIEVITKHDPASKSNSSIHIHPSWWKNKIGAEKDTIIIFDPETFREKTIIRPQLDVDFSIGLTYENDIITLKSKDAYWTELTFELTDGESQIIDFNGLAESRNHYSQFSFEILKDDNQFTFRNNHGFDWVEMQTNCNKWIYSKTEITKSGVEINCF